MNKEILSDIYDKIGRCKSEGVEIKLHPNGFLQLPLDSTDKRSSHLQLHIWHTSIQRRGDKQFEIHDHAFDIESNPLLGSLHDVIYSVHENYNGKYFIFEADGQGQMKLTQKRVSLITERDRIITEGETYSIKKGDFHSSNPLSPFTVTLVKKSNVDVYYRPKLIAPDYYKKSSIEVSREFDQAKSWLLVTSALQIIKGKFSLY